MANKLTGSWVFAALKKIEVKTNRDFNTQEVVTDKTLLLLVQYGKQNTDFLPVIVPRDRQSPLPPLTPQKRYGIPVVVQLERNNLVNYHLRDDVPPIDAPEDMHGHYIFGKNLGLKHTDFTDQKTNIVKQIPRLEAFVVYGDGRELKTSFNLPRSPDYQLPTLEDENHYGFPTTPWGNKKRRRLNFTLRSDRMPVDCPEIDF